MQQDPRRLPYKRMERVTVDVTDLRAFIAQWPFLLRISKSLKPFTGINNVSI